LRILFQLTIEEIAEAFLTNKETINKRLFRAKEKLRDAGIELELPEGIRLEDRLQAVLRVLYLLFNQGYASSSPDLGLRKDLCLEALRLNLLLTEDPRTNTPTANALLALMCFHASRFDARLDDNGGTVLYDEQDRSRWNRDLIARGTYFLLRSAQGDHVDKYHLEAGIADRHAQLVEMPDKWTAILALYDRLVLVDPSPMVGLNRAYAVFRVHGAEAAIREAEQLPLDDSPLFHTLLGELYGHIDSKRALLHFQRALNLARNDVERKVISAKMRR
jgi:RNA polymerase sigma-70 factor (ECF subfamily)